MRRLVALLRSLVRSAFRGLASSPVTTAIATITIAVTLVLMGAFVMLLENMQGLVDRFGQDLHVTVYVEDGVGDAAREALAERARGLDGVARVTSVSKEEALRRFEAGVGAHTGLFEALDENPLPASLEIALVPERRTPGGLQTLIEAMEGWPGIAEVAYGQEWVEGYARLLALLRGGAIALGVVLALATLLIVANTIRLAVYARRDELEILALVGASRGFAGAPFVLEGLIQGAVGAALALLLLRGVFEVVLPGVRTGVELLLGFATPAFLSARAMFWLLVGGAALGGIGSAAALLGGPRA